MTSVNSKPAAAWPTAVTIFEPELSSQRIATATVTVLRPASGDHANGTNISVEIHTEPALPGFEHDVTLYIRTHPFGDAPGDMASENFRVMDDEIDGLVSALGAAVLKARETGVLAPVAVAGALTLTAGKSA